MHFRDEITLQMNCEFEIVASVDEEGEDVSSSTRSIIVHKLCKRKEIGLVILLIVSVYADILLQWLISMFHWSMALQMIKWSCISSAFLMDQRKCDTNSIL